MGFIFLGFLPFLCLDCGLSNQAKKKKNQNKKPDLGLDHSPEANICVQDLDHRGNLIGQGNRQHLTLALILFL